MVLTERKGKIHNAINELPPRNLNVAPDFPENSQRSDEGETQALFIEPGFIGADVVPFFF